LRGDTVEEAYFARALDISSRSASVNASLERRRGAGRIPRAAPAENKSTMTVYQTLAQSLSAPRHPASDPKALFSLPL